ncbi:MAG: 16S rRNA (guanine(527)-N(7))-methyltransferase RsmG [Defluviitaleaceae bacterium]|nr:16S rRNA (guanine(527)-N(7))-methyltransferase RsmG [Defluviitaleaceae bacterium]
MRKDIVTNWLANTGHTLTQSQLASLARYQELVLSAPFNLTAITNSEDFAIKHFIDSYTLLPWLDDMKITNCIDIGSGAGFPGVPLKIARPTLRITLLDSLLKRVLFLRAATQELGLTGVECIHARAEDHVKQKGAAYDLATARAVARLGKLAGYALPLVKPGGVFLAMKGPDAAAEIEEALPILHKHGSAVESVQTVEISQEIGRSIIVIRKH